MKIIDRYIIRLFLINFVILTVVFMLMFMLVDFISDSDEFVEAGRVRGLQLAESLSNKEAIAEIEDGARPSLGHMAMGVLWVIGDWFGPSIILMFVFLSGLLVTGAMGFTFVSLVRNREIIALVASGVSMHRIAAPVLVAGVALNLLTFPLQEWVVPPLADKLIRRKSEMKHERTTQFAVEFSLDQRGSLISASRLDGDLMYDVVIFFRDKKGNTEKRVIADEAEWDPQLKLKDERQWNPTLKLAEETPKGGWRLIGGMVDEPIAGGALQQYANQGGEPYQCYITNLSPKLLTARRAGVYARLLGSADLLALRNDPILGSLASKILHSRFSLMVVSALVLVMGLPFFMLRLPTNMVMQSAKAAGVCLGAWAGGLVLLQVGSGSLPPVVAAWLPVVIFLPVSAALLQLVET